MKLALVSKKVLIFGGEGFTGKHLVRYLKNLSYDVSVSSCDITDFAELLVEIKEVNPEFIINLAAISFVGHGKNEEFYKVNSIGAINILDVLLKLELNPKRVILVSSATVYGNQNKEILDESLCPSPSNHYGASKLSMENLSCEYFDKLNIVITRTFNYTGVGQEEHFLIPKIVKHFKEKKRVIELGNIHVSREFNDIEFICEVYERFLTSSVKSEIVNVCSNRAVKLLDIISLLEDISGYNIEIEINPAFVRKNEIKVLTGSPKKLFKLVGYIEQKSLQDTLKEMYEV